MKKIAVFSNDSTHTILYKAQLKGKFEVVTGELCLSDVDLVILNTTFDKPGCYKGIEFGELIKKNYPEIAIVWVTTDLLSLDSNLKEKERCLGISHYLLFVPADNQANNMLDLIEKALKEKE